MTLPPFGWQNAPNLSTPLSAQELESFAQFIVNYFGGNESGSTGDGFFVRSDGTIHRYTPPVVSVQVWGASPSASAATNQAALTAAFASGQRVGGPPGVYQVSSSVVVGSGTCIEGGNGKGSGVGMTIKAAGGFPAGTPVLDAATTPVHAVTIRDLVIDCAGAADDGIWIDSDTQTENAEQWIEGCTVLSHNRTGIKTGGSGHVAVCHVLRNLVAGNSASSNTSQRGIWAVNADTIIENNRVQNHKQSGIYCQGGGTQIKGNHVFAHSTVQTDGSAPTCITIGQGGLINITENYLDNFLQNAAISIVSDTVGQSINRILIANNKAICGPVFQNSAGNGNGNWPFLHMDQTIAGISNVNVISNEGVANATTPFTAILDHAAGGGQPTNVRYYLNTFDECTSFSNAAYNEFGFNTKTLAGNILRQSYRQSALTLSYSASITPSGWIEFQIVPVTNGSAFTINNPGNTSSGSVITFEIQNNSGGAMGNVTWGGAYKTDWNNGTDLPANGQRHTITFYYNGSNWVQTAKGAIA